MREISKTSINPMVCHEGGYLNSPKDMGGATKYRNTHRISQSAKCYAYAG